MLFVSEQRLVERMVIEKQCDVDTAPVIRCLYEQEVHQVKRSITMILLNHIDESIFSI